MKSCAATSAGFAPEGASCATTTTTRASSTAWSKSTWSPPTFVIQSRAEIAPSKLANDAIEAAFVRRQSVCDVTARQALRDMCETLVGGLPSDGEFLAQIRSGTLG